MLAWPVHAGYKPLMTVWQSLLFLCLFLASRLGKRLGAGGGLLDVPVQDGGCTRQLLRCHEGCCLTLLLCHFLTHSGTELFIIQAR
jgi:hypothetical protein